MNTMGLEGSVLICDEVAPLLNKVLQENGLDVTYRPTITAEEIKGIISEFNIIIVRSRTTITAEMIQNATKCKIIARVGVGLDNIDLDSAKKSDIRVINAVEGATTAVAELVLGFMFSLARQIPKMDRGIRNDMWLKKESLGSELKGKYLGIVGMGNIGKRLARLAKGLNMNIIGFDVQEIDPEFIKEVGMMKADLNTLLQSSDYITLHVPLLKSTKHLINKTSIDLMKNTACVINTSRGGVVDENALYDAIKSKNLGGAALDVFETEPALGNKLSTLDNVILTPHMGAQTREAQSLAANVIAEKIVQILRGVI
ncbi:MAG: D-2-hydroxyacid dehydrogenase [Candidatus Nitrosoabyssus spongiisocia]|nr:MAG: D-2-hydroxyacid dehydrogenase [Nitrosopumilaceae archaeon AB1(1)]